MTDIKTLVRKLLAGKLPQKEMPELWQRHDVTQYMQREWDRCAKPAEDDLLRESRIWERIEIKRERKSVIPKKTTLPAGSLIPRMKNSKTVPDSSNGQLSRI